VRPSQSARPPASSPLKTAWASKIKMIGCLPGLGTVDSWFVSVAMAKKIAGGSAASANPRYCKQSNQVIQLT
jgi:hypothetical protein